MREATSLSEATQEKTSGFKNEFIGKTTNNNKVKSNKKSSKGVSSHNIHLFTQVGEKQHGRRGWRPGGRCCWMRVTVMTAG